jgi:hypothetical protein
MCSFLVWHIYDSKELQRYVDWIINLIKPPILDLRYSEKAHPIILNSANFGLGGFYVCSSCMQDFCKYELTGYLYINLSITWQF